MKWFRKKKENNITVNVEIDYEKLGKSVADAIVKKERAEAERYSVTREWFKYILFAMIIIMGLLAVIISGYCFYKSYTLWDKALGDSPRVYWLEGAKMIGYFVSGLFLLGMTGFAVAAQKEIEEEMNRQFIATVFSGVVALVALIVALLALVKNIS